MLNGYLGVTTFKRGQPSYKMVPIFAGCCLRGPIRRLRRLHLDLCLPGIDHLSVENGREGGKQEDRQKVGLRQVGALLRVHLRHFRRPLQHEQVQSGFHLRAKRWVNKLGTVNLFTISISFVYRQVVCGHKLGMFDRGRCRRNEASGSFQVRNVPKILPLIGKKVANLPQIGTFADTVEFWLNDNSKIWLLFSKKQFFQYWPKSS